MGRFPGFRVAVLILDYFQQFNSIWWCSAAAIRETTKLKLCRSRIWTSFPCARATINPGPRCAAYTNTMSDLVTKTKNHSDYPAKIRVVGWKCKCSGNVILTSILAYIRCVVHKAGGSCEEDEGLCKGNGIVPVMKCIKEVYLVWLHPLVYGL